MEYTQTESVRGNKVHQILWDFEIQIDTWIPTRWPYLVLISQKLNK